PEGKRPELEGEYVAPRTAEQEALAKIWCEVLGLERVGVEDNFFEVGGDSILSIQVISRAKRSGLELTPTQMFEEPTVAGQARVARRKTEEAEGRAAGEVELTAIQRWFFEQELEEGHHWNQAVMLRTTKRARPELLEKALQAVVEQHDGLRMRFERDGEMWRQRYGEGDAGTILKVCEVEAEGAEERQRAIDAVVAEAQASLSLERGPLMRAALFELGDDGQRLLLVIHHLVVDGVSWRILLDDLQAAYRQLEEQGRVDLGARTTSYQRWAER